MYNKNSENKFKHDNLTRNKCPNCGKFMLEVNGKRGKMLVCEDRECNTRKLISQTTNARCPNCHKVKEKYLHVVVDIEKNFLHLTKENLRKKGRHLKRI